MLSLCSIKRVRVSELEITKYRERIWKEWNRQTNKKLYKESRNIAFQLKFIFIMHQMQSFFTLTVIYYIQKYILVVFLFFHFRYCRCKQTTHSLRKDTINVQRSIDYSTIVEQKIEKRQFWVTERKLKGKKEKCTKVNNIKPYAAHVIYG